MRRRALLWLVVAAARAQDVHNETALAAGIADGATLYVAEATLVITAELAVADGVDCAIRRRGGLASATLDGADASRLFAVDGWLTLDSLTLTRGAAPSYSSCGVASTNCNGGAVWVGASGRLTLVGVTLVANEWAYRGGAVFVSGGRVIASRSTFDDNFAMHSVRGRDLGGSRVILGRALSRFERSSLRLPRTFARACTHARLRALARSRLALSGRRALH